MKNNPRASATDHFSRRAFIKLGGAGAAAVAAGTASGCTSDDAPPSPTEVSMEDEWWTAESFELEEVSIQDQVDGMASGRWTASDITEMYLDRIARLNREGPRLRAVIETNPEAMEIAAALDRERAAGNLRGPLHGIPILLKDNIDTGDRMTTAAGSLALQGSMAPRDSWVAGRLRDAGAIMLGKANLSEWANIRSSDSSSGWSARGGQCANPYALDRNPCGSSSGSGAGASANFCAGAIGTETNGSIICPASINGVVGIKPTVGLVGRSGIIPIAHTQDTAGPMTRTVRDGALMLGVLTGVDPRDDSTMASSGNSHGDYTQFLDVEGLRGARIGVERSYFGNNSLVDDLMEQALVDLAKAGATLVDPALHPTRGRMGRPQFTVLMYELKADLAVYLATLGPNAPVKTLADVIAFNEKNSAREMPYFGQDLLIQAEESGTLQDSRYLEALELAGRLSRAEGLDALLAEHRLDAVVSPSTTPAWKTDLVNGDGASHGSASMAAIAGYASVTVPMGFVRGLPVGILFTAGRWSESTVLRLAYAYEQATLHRAAPRMPTSLDLRNRIV